MGKHIPVLLKETIDGLNVKKDGIYLDLTVGRGGHSSEILKKLDTGYLIGVDQDIEAINESQKNLGEVGSNFELVHQNFISFINILKEKGIDPALLINIDPNVLIDIIGSAVSEALQSDKWKNKIKLR